MRWIEAKILIEKGDRQLAADLLTSIFYDLGQKGVVIQDPDEEPVEGWGDDTGGGKVEKKSGRFTVAGFFPENEYLTQRCGLLENKLAELEQNDGIKTGIVYNKIDEVDWAESWKEYFWPEKISGQITVKPTWREYEAAEGEIVIELDPGMAFGTGTHPTTSLCINMIEKYLEKGDSFLDVGTGSGILMIIASKLGAGFVFGVDNDEVAVKVSKENLRINDIKDVDFKVKSGNLTKVVEKRFNFVTANILSGVVLVLLDDIERVLAKDGVLICSVITVENQEKVVKKMEKVGFEIIESCSKENWVAIAGRMKMTS